MQVTIGEVTDFILPFSTHIDMSIMHRTPFLQANLCNDAHITKCVLYVAQTEPHIYTLTATQSSGAGERYFPSRFNSKSLINERDVIRQKFGSGSPDPSWYTDVHNSLGYPEAIHQIIRFMSSYEVIRFKDASNEIIMTQMDISSTRIKRAVEKAFKESTYHEGSITDFVDWTIVKNQPFQLRGLKPKEIQCIISKLRNLGLTCTVSEDTITSVTFERK